MKRRQVLRRAGVTLATSTALAGCSGLGSGGDNPLPGNGDSEPKYKPKGGPDTGELTVDMTGPPKAGSHTYDPRIAWVEPGATVKFHTVMQNMSATAYHPKNNYPLRIPEEAENFDTHVIPDRDIVRDHTFETPGVYDFFSKPYEDEGMVGSIIVGEPEPDPEKQPGLAPPQDNLISAAKEEIRTLNEKVTTILEGGTVTE